MVSLPATLRKIINQVAISFYYVHRTIRRNCIAATCMVIGRAKRSAVNAVHRDKLKPVIVCRRNC